jgi:3-oxoacyl-[acyl-carrier protein] reductase
MLFIIKKLIMLVFWYKDIFLSKTIIFYFMNIIITGASKGIGKATAISFCKEGNHKIFLISRDKNRLEELRIFCNSINRDCEVTVIPFDLNNTRTLKELSEIILFRAGSIDILINNAGTLFNKKFVDLSDSEINSMFSTNFFAPASLIRYLIPGLEKAGKAHVVNIGSMGGFQGSVKYPGLSYYSASKAALSVLTECLAEEYKTSGISFNCLALGAVETEMFSEAFPGAKAPVSPEEMAEYIVRFSMTGHKSRNGKIIPVTSADLI